MINWFPNVQIHYYFIVVGDFNLTGNGFHPKAITRNSKLKQIIKEPTRGSNILDLVFTDISAMFEPPRILAPVGSSDHATVLVESKVHAPKKKAIRKVIVRPLKESSLQAFDDYLKQIDRFSSKIMLLTRLRYFWN